MGRCPRPLTLASLMRHSPPLLTHFRPAFPLLPCHLILSSIPLHSLHPPNLPQRLGIQVPMASISSELHFRWIGWPTRQRGCPFHPHICTSTMKDTPDGKARLQVYPCSIYWSSDTRSSQNRSQSKPHRPRMHSGRRLVLRPHRPSTIGSLTVSPDVQRIIQRSSGN